jgi:hypothetical protein
MSTLDAEIDAIFAELERSALCGEWKDSEKERAWHACNLDVLKENGEANYAHTRLSHLMALYSAIAVAPESKELEAAAIKLGTDYLVKYPSSREFFLPALLTEISRDDGGGR